MSSFLSNIFLTLLLGAVFIYFLQRKGLWKLGALLPVLFIIASTIVEYTPQVGPWPTYLAPQYGLYGFIIIALFYLADPLLKVIYRHLDGMDQVTFDEYLTSDAYHFHLNVVSCVLFGGFIIIHWVIFTYIFPLSPWAYSDPLQNYCLLAIPFILLYNHKKGYSRKWFRIFSYVFYPAHLAILFSIIALSSGAFF
jgi:hypothetical protein